MRFVAVAALFTFLVGCSSDGEQTASPPASGGSSGNAGSAGYSGVGGSAGTAQGGSSGTAGSGGNSDGGLDAGNDATNDVASDGPVDAATDGTVDSPIDVATDSASDSQADSGNESGSDADAAREEICNGIDDDGDSEVDEGCDDDGDDFCDNTMVMIGITVPECPNGPGDCDDDNIDIHPGSTVHVEGVDYDCDLRREFMAEVVISVDDLLIDLCANGTHISPFGPNAGQWPYADTYQIVLESGDNVIGVAGRDTGLTISAFVATVKVDGQFIRTDGVLPPASGVPYTPSDPEWNQTPWRYYPNPGSDPESSWCDVYFDDAAWGPAIVAKSTNCAADPQLGELGHCPWHFVDCGGGEHRCPLDFVPYYDDAIANNEPLWVWDYNPVSLADAWFRLRVSLPL